MLLKKEDISELEKLLNITKVEGKIVDSEKVKATPLTAKIRYLIKGFLSAESNKQSYQALEKSLEDYALASTTAGMVSRTLDQLTYREMCEIKKKFKQEYGDVFKRYANLGKLEEVKRQREEPALGNIVMEVLKKYKVGTITYKRILDDFCKLIDYPKKTLYELKTKKILLEINERFKHGNNGVYKRYDELGELRGELRQKEEKELRETVTNILNEYDVGCIDNYGQILDEVRIMVKKPWKTTKKLGEHEDKNHLNLKQVRDKDNKIYVGMLTAGIRILFGKDQKAESDLTNILYMYQGDRESEKKSEYHDYLSKFEKENFRLLKLIKKLKTNYERICWDETKRFLWNDLWVLTKRAGIRSFHSDREAKIKKAAYDLIKYGLEGLAKKAVAWEDKEDIEGRTLEELEEIYRESKKDRITHTALAEKYEFISMDNFFKALERYGRIVTKDGSDWSGRKKGELKRLYRDFRKEIFKPDELVRKYAFVNEKNMLRAIERYEDMVMKDGSDVHGRKIRELKKLDDDARRGVNHNDLTKMYAFVIKENMLAALELYRNLTSRYHYIKVVEAMKTGKPI